jgi:hypothetical protein
MRSNVRMNPDPWPVMRVVNSVYLVRVFPCDSVADWVLKERKGTLTLFMLFMVLHSY